jgi:benzoylformate decarboxylase
MSERALASERAPGAPDERPPAGRRTVRDETFEILRRLGLTTMYANPGSTEVEFLAGLPGDFRFVLGLHESSVVAMATGWAIARGEPALVLLHTTAGLGNAVAALATARVNRAPVVVLVGQQDRRHLAQEPFLTGRLEALAGDYPVWVNQPVRAQDVPGAIVRAHHESISQGGPALVIVPMGDWLEDAGEAHELAAPSRLVRATGVDDASVGEIADLLVEARSPALVVGAGACSPGTWAALAGVAERLGCPVWQEPFGARAGFPQDHPLFAGHLPAERGELREALAGHDVVVVVGTGMLRQFSYSPGPFVMEGTRVALVTANADEANRSPVEIAVLADLAPFCAALAERLPGPTAKPAAPLVPPLPAPPPPAAGEPMRAAHVLHALSERLPPDTVLLEESPSTRLQINYRLPARHPLGFVSAAMGGLGFAIPGAIGVRMALPDRPVVAVVGDGSSLYNIQAVWSAATYGTGPLFVVLANGGYAIMDSLAEKQGASAPWPGFEEIDIAAIARGFGCQAMRIERLDELVDVLDRVLPDLAGRQEPLLLEVVVRPD